jgi:hypothetical protein
MDACETAKGQKAKPRYTCKTAEKEKKMLSLIYVSSSMKQLSDQELLDILKTSRENNLAHDITGLLLYKGGNFMQALEGADDAVRALYKKIEQDPRHKDVSIISSEQIQARQFSAWEMAFQNLDAENVRNEAGYSQFLHDEFTAEVYRKNPLRAYIMLLTFRDNVR